MIYYLFHSYLPLGNLSTKIIEKEHQQETVQKPQIILLEEEIQKPLKVRRVDDSQMTISRRQDETDK